MKRTVSQRILSAIVCLALLLSYLPGGLLRAHGAEANITTVADPETLTRPGTIYGDNTLNAGKITVGKSVSNGAITVNGQTIGLDGKNNFLVTISQSAQVMGLTSETDVPVDVVFVIDTSGSMEDNDRAETLVTAANSAIKTLLETNEQNRIAVVAFSSEDYGNGTSGGAAANVLSSLAHYSGNAATNHLQWVNQNGSASGNDRVYIAGRDTATIRVNNRNQTVNAFRHGKSGGTNIQAGIVEGAKILTAVQDTTWTNPDTNEVVTRIPFLIVISDGQPTFTYDDDTWFDPAITGNNAANEQGPGSDAYEGNGFIAALTAAYYKGLITDHYYGENASGDNHCFVYTMGVEIEALDDTNQGSVVGVNQSLAQITLDPSSQTVGSYAADGAKSYWNFGNTAFEDAQDAAYGWKTYWNNYLAGNEFTVRVNEGDAVDVWVGEGAEGSGAPQRGDYRNNWEYQRAYEAWYNANYETRYPGQMYTFTAESIAASKQYVSGIGYNDAYFAADDVSDMESIFKALVATIQEKAISVPTKVTTGNYDFDGYVNFYDPIGEYMEVKDMKGLLAGGYFYQGASFAQKMANYGTANADANFDALIHRVIKTRMGLSSADSRFESEAALDAFIHDLLIAARDSGNQANYTNKDNFDNSFVWWGNAYDAGEEDEHVQLIGFADNDTIDYITDENTQIPEGADYVCRSYFFYGEAGGANPNPDHEYLYFVIRVQRELTAPYRQTVVISAPASLLSMEKVLITETYDDNGNPVYTATVEHQEPARVVYEVGLWDTITPENVALIVSADYAGEQVNGFGSVNYDPTTGVYNFFTNDWDRSQSLDSHHRGMAKATFDAAADNGFYTYQEDTLLVDANGNPVTADPKGTTAYYVREYYEWSDDDKDGTYTATKKTQLIEVDIPADTVLIEKDGAWYIPAGTYTAATLVVNGDDTLKDDPTTEAENDGNKTGTSSIVAHPHRTGDADNSHYTVYLGNNGKLSLVSEPYEPKKDVSITGADGTTITDGNGKPVQVGDVLTYTIEVENVLTENADITVTDYVPLGTAFVAGSAGKDASGADIVPDGNNVLTWVLENVAPGEVRTVSFQVTVEPGALSLNVVSGTIENTARVTIGNSPTISTNPTYNPPYGKTVTDDNGAGADGEGGYKVGDILVYHIRVTNTATDADGNFIPADVTVTDIIPQGTVYVEGSADNGGVYDDGVITWKFENMPAGSAKVVSFRVQITADIKGEDSGDQPVDGEIAVENSATIQVENNPTITTNTTVNKVDVGDMVITKVVAAGGDQSKVFTIHLTESTGALEGTYVLERDGVAETVTFVGGKASVTIRHGQKLTIRGLPVGAILSVEEDTANLPGWTPTYNTRSVTITKGAATTVSSVSVTNTYTLKPLTLTLNGVKNMSGATLTEPVTFGFVATPDAGNPEVGDPLTGQVTVTGNGTFTFTMSPKVFTKPGVYKYTITEINGGVLGVNYDGTVHQLEINVIDNGDGTMRAEAKLNGAAFSMANGAVPFSNTYNPEDTTLVFAADKELTGRDLTAGEFSFVLYNSEHTYRGFNDANGNIVFETIRFTTPGTYVFTLAEEIPGTKAEGMTYDTDTYTVVVTVTDAGGQLVTAVTIDGQPLTVENGVVDTGVLFSNRFVPSDAPLKITAKKTLLVYNPASGSYEDTAPEAGKFHFQITDESGAVLAIGSNDGKGNVVFETIYLSAALLEGVTPDANGNKSKIFTFTITEVVSDYEKDPNMKYDLNGRQIQVLLTHTASGQLIVAINGDDDGNVDLTSAANFVNYSNPDSVSVTPVGTKTTVGENLPAGLSFSFQVIPVGGDTDAAIGTSDATVGGKNSETDHITFTSIVYTHESLNGKDTETYRYWIMESNSGAGNNGVTYDTTRYLYQVTLTRDENGRLIATESYFKLREGGDAQNPADYTVAVDGANVTFTNTYAAKAHINLTADKTLTGREPGLAAGEFEFVLNRLDAQGNLVPGSQIAGYNDANGVIHFATLNYSNEMLTDAYKHTDGAFYFSYLMTEVKPAGTAVPGVTYDDAAYVVTIKVTQEGENGMTAVLAGVSKAAKNGDSYAPGTAVEGFTAAGDTNITFTNVYQAVEGDVIKYQIRKDLQGRTIRTGEFEFGLYLDGQLVEVATNDENGIVTFSRIVPATAAAYAGTYKMVIKEIPGNEAGVTYSTEEYVIYVKVEDNGTGKIEATVHLTEDGPALDEDATGMVDLTDVVVFHNIYKASGTTYTPVAEKSLTGRKQIAGEFSFQAQLIHDGASVANGAIYRGVNDADGNVIFQSISFDKVGTYIFRITEVQGTSAGMAYDSKAYYLKVEVTDDGNGYLKASGAYYSDEECTKAVSGVVFHNAYTPASVPVQLVGNKTLVGRELKDNEFSFLVYKQGSTTPIASGSNDANGVIHFSTFNITAQDMMDENGNFVASRTFTFVIVESDNKHPGVTYAAPVNVTVTVTNDNGVFTAKVTYPEGNGAQFTNIYTPNPVSVPLVAYKTLTGKNMQTFEFVLTAPDGTETVVTNDGDGIITLPSLHFTAEDMVDENGNKVMEKTFVYTLTETAGSMNGMHYDQTVYTITVTVKDDGQGNLTAETTYKAGSQAVEILRFVNRYTPPMIEVELEGVKTIVDSEGNVLTGENFPLNGFTFLVFDAEGNLVCETTSDAQGNIRFTGFRFAAAGEYRFTIWEKDSYKAGYTNDPTIWCAHITIGYNADTGALYEANEYIHVAPETHDGVAAHGDEQISFTNVYDPADVDVVLKGLKNLEGRELREHEFTFYMVDNATGLRAAESRNHGNGEIHFSLHYSKAGTYTYTVYEEIPAESGKLHGVTYTTKTHQITVEVTDDGTGALKAKVGDITVLGNGSVDLTDTVIFNNIYTPENGKAVVEAWKYLEGKKLESSKYTFQLVNQADPSEKYTATNGADGRVSFDALVFTAEDMVDANGNKVMEKVFTYTLSEVAGNEPGVTYDEEVYTVTITVTDDGMGNLLTKVTYANSNAESFSLPTFHNIYKADPVTYIPEVKKIFEGGAMRTFDFVLSGEGFETQIKQNDGEGNVTFDTLTFDKAGTYTFTISEQVNESMEDVKFDTNVYTLVIHVADPGDGQLVIREIEIRSAHGRQDLIFRNVHEDLITQKDVFVGDESISIDGEAVKKGDILTYVITYKNYTGLNADVTITDLIPAHTTYVEGSATNGGVLSDGKLTWEFTDVAPDAVITVSFQVEVTGTNVTVENQSTVLEGENTYTSNTVTTMVPEDKVEKDVFNTTDPTVSIDGETVKKGDTLTYTITYSNSYEAAADVVITDIIPEFTAYVDGSASHNGIFADGKLTWNLHLQAGESVTVSFQVTVTGSNVTVSNQATALESGNTIETNVVTTLVPEDKVEKEVFNTTEPTVSIDGQIVKKGDVLLFVITYANSYEAAADVVITDTIPEFTTYVEGSADNGGVFADGKITWNLHLEAGESKTVSFQVTVDGANVTVTNQATAQEGENKLETNIVTTLVPEDKVEKDVHLVSDPTISMDGAAVKLGDILAYTITYSNSYEAAADVVITDTIPEFTTYVDGSADNGGVFADGKLTWNLHLEAGESVTVSFQVEVTGANATVENQAQAMEGTNVYETNTVTTMVPKDEVKKDVFSAADPTVSIDGAAVKLGDILTYVITYSNSYEAAADVVITDIIPEFTTYVDGSADNGGIFADGKLTWNLHLQAGESKTVSFQVKVTGANVTVSNQATALEAGNELVTNIVTTIVPDLIPETADHTDLAGLLSILGLSGMGIWIMLAFVLQDQRKKTMEN